MTTDKMTTKPVGITSPTSSTRGAKNEHAVPSAEAVAKKAYEIWLSEGQKSGCDQKNWFEAERQLQRA